LNIQGKEELSKAVLVSLYVQCNPHQNSHDILHSDRKSNPNIHMEAQKTLTSQRCLKHAVEKRQSLQQMVLRKLDIC
jgi:hypothetical protein